MVNVLFKNVGQGDSILVSWKNDEGSIEYGVIDCNLYQSRNPLLDELKGITSLSKLKFLIISHPHEDHYSGIGELLYYCIDKKIDIEYLLHTCNTEFSHMMDKVRLSMRAQQNLVDFIQGMDDAIKQGITQNVAHISHLLVPVSLYSNVQLKFLAPNGEVDFRIAKARNRNLANETTTKPDLNRLGTISLFTNGSKAILLTSDAAKSSFRRIKDKIDEKLELVQIPHHGSKGNLNEPFWRLRNKSQSCPAVLSIGDIAKDKLPDEYVVEFFDKLGYQVESTNDVYGITSYFKTGTSGKIPSASTQLNAFSRKRSSSASLSNGRFSGDKKYAIRL